MSWGVEGRNARDQILVSSGRATRQSQGQHHFGNILALKSCYRVSFSSSHCPRVESSAPSHSAPFFFDCFKPGGGGGAGEHLGNFLGNLFKYIFFRLEVKDQSAISYFSTSLIRLIQVYKWEIRHNSLFCYCGLADILYTFFSPTVQAFWYVC